MTTWVDLYQKKHSPINTNPDNQTSFINFLHLLQSIASSPALSSSSLRDWQSFSTTSVQVLFVFLSVWDPLLHTSYFSSPSHHLLFATHAHTIAAYSAVIPVLLSILNLCQLTWKSVFYLNATHPSDHSSLLMEVPPHFLSLQARSHFHATYCFTLNYSTPFLS